MESVACNLCGAENEEELYASNLNGNRERDDRLRCTDSTLGAHGRIVRCRQCGLVYTTPRERSDAILDAYQAVDDPTYVAEERGRMATFHRSLRLIHRYRRPPGRLLDVGCYTGLFLGVARDAGWTVKGVEPSRWACRVAQDRYRIEVQCGTLATLSVGDGLFDVATMWDTLEHYTDPLGELRRTYDVLAPGGLLALTTIDMGSLIARCLGGRWWWFMEMHLYYFTRQTVAVLLQRAGFEVVGIHQHVRVISLRYLWTRLEPMCGGLARASSRMADSLTINDWCAPIMLGDLMTVVARRAA